MELHLSCTNPSICGITIDSWCTTLVTQAPFINFSRIYQFLKKISVWKYFYILWITSIFDRCQSSCMGCSNSRQYMNFLHDRPWISPWMKSISSKLDITIHVIVSQLSDHCDVTSNQLWCHQQSDIRASETQRWCVKIVIFIVIYGFVMSCKKQNNVCTLMRNCFCAHSSVIFMFISLVASQLGK